MGLDNGKDLLEKDIAKLAEARKRHFEKHLRSSMNEWMLQDYWEWYDDLNKVLERDRVNGIISNERYQSLLVIAVDYGTKITKITKMIENYEKEEDYLSRLCGVF